MKVTVKELSKVPGGVLCSLQIRGRRPQNKAPVRERYTREFVTMTAAKSWGEERANAIIQGHDEHGPTAPPLSVLWADYEEKHVNGQRLKPSQKRSLQSLWDNHLEPVFGKTRIDAIDYAAVQAFKASRSAKAPKTVNNALIALKAVLRFAQKTGRLTELPQIELLKVTKTAPVHYDVPTYNKLVTAALGLSDRHAAVVLLGGDAGLRAGEIIALDDTDLALPMLTVRRSVWRTHGGSVKGHAERVLPLTARTVAVLERLAATPGPVIRTRVGTRMNYTMLIRLLRQAQKAAKVPALSLHKLRHTYGTDITRALGIRAAQALLGHAEVTTTERYAHVHAGAETARALEAHRAIGGQHKPSRSRGPRNTERKHKR